MELKKHSLSSFSFSINLDNGFARKKNDDDYKVHLTNWMSKQNNWSIWSLVFHLATTFKVYRKLKTKHNILRSHNIIINIFSGRISEIKMMIFNKKKIKDFLVFSCCCCCDHDGEFEAVWYQTENMKKQQQQKRINLTRTTTTSECMYEFHENLVNVREREREIWFFLFGYFLIIFLGFFYCFSHGSRNNWLVEYKLNKIIDPIIFVFRTIVNFFYEYE